MSARIFASASLLIAGLVASTVDAEVIVINNGLAPPLESNVISAGSSDFEDHLYVRNLGCPQSIDEACEEPGDPTQVRIAPGAMLASISVMESSSLEFEEATTGSIRLEDSASAVVHGWFHVGFICSFEADDDATASITGPIADGLRVTARQRAVVDIDVTDLTPVGVNVNDYASVHLRGGTATQRILTYGHGQARISGGILERGVSPQSQGKVVIEGGTIAGEISTPNGGEVVIKGGVVTAELSPYGGQMTVIGSDFAVDGEPVPYGSLSATTGRLTGSLIEGGTIDSVFAYEGAPPEPPEVTTITLVPHESVEVLIANGMAPPEPENVIDSPSEFAGSTVRVRDLGCGQAGAGPCTAPGIPTEVEIQPSGAVGYDLIVHDTSIASVVGGVVWGYVEAKEASTLVLDQGRLNLDVRLTDEAEFSMSEGVVQGRLYVEGGAYAEIAGGEVVRMLYCSGDSTVEITNGVLGHWALVCDAASLRLSGGSMSELDLRDEAVFSMSGGEVRWTVMAGPSTSMVISGGRILGRLSTHGEVVLEGGEIGGELAAFIGGHVVVRGGQIGGEIEVSGLSIVQIEGTDFALDGEPVPFGVLEPWFGELTGTLPTGEPISAPIRRSTGGYSERGIIELIEVPEPSATSGVLAALLTLASLRRRHRV